MKSIIVISVACKHIKGPIFITSRDYVVDSNKDIDKHFHAFLDELEGKSLTLIQFCIHILNSKKIFDALIEAKK